MLGNQWARILCSLCSDGKVSCECKLLSCTDHAFWFVSLYLLYVDNRQGGYYNVGLWEQWYLPLFRYRSIFCLCYLCLYMATVWLEFGYWVCSMQRRTHTLTHPFNGPFSRTTRVSQCQKGKTNLDFTEARDSEWQWHQLGHMQIYSEWAVS